MSTNQTNLRELLRTEAEKRVQKYLKAYSGTRGFRGSTPGSPWDELWSGLGKVIVEYSRKYEGDSPTTPNPEETAVILIRSGVPEAAVKVCHKHLTISLSNSTFRIYREPSGCGSGSIRILSPGTSPVIHLDISSQALAELTLELDAALDDVNAVMASLKEKIKEEDLRRQVEAKTRDIERTTLNTLLDTVLAPLGIIGYFNIKDGVVSLRLVKALQADLEMPFDEMAGFLADPQKVNDALKVVSVDEFRDLSHIGGNHLGRIIW